MHFERNSGVLLHISSLPSPYGIGDFGPDAYRFVDWLESANQKTWQILPFGMANLEGSPYSCLSAFGGYNLLISPQMLHNDGLLTTSDLELHSNDFKLDDSSVDYQKVRKCKTDLFFKAYQHFTKREDLQKSFQEFLEIEKEWIDDLALFKVITLHYGYKWTKWPTELKNKKPSAISSFKEKFAQQIELYKFFQYEFFKQWNQLKTYANSKGIQIIGDIPIFIAHHSMEVWKNPQWFVLDDDGEMELETGAAPDSFSDAGQKWNNPNYNWDLMEKDNFSWWISRMEFMLRYYDIIRLDHFRGFAATWMVPTTHKNATNGHWVPGPGDKLFHVFKKNLKSLPLIAEDLGEITPDVIALREKFDLPGMKVLQFAFCDEDSNQHLPHNYEGENWVCYPGTHDNDTIRGWYDSLPQGLEKAFLHKFIGTDEDEMINWDLIKIAIDSKANTVVISLQDILGIGTESRRLNVPGTPDNNWKWRFKWNDLTSEHLEKLAKLTSNANR